MEVLLEQSRQLTSFTTTDFVRDIMQTIDWNARLILIRGPRGVGKTTVLLQHLKLHFGLSGEGMYITLDDFYFSEVRLSEVAKTFAQTGGKVLYIDEIHRYPHGSWAQEIKNIYDLIPGLKLVLTGSSIMAIHHRQADLSRRAIIYEMAGLSYREYLTFTTGKRMPGFSLTDILLQPQHAAETIIQDVGIRPMASLEAYMTGGYYPFFVEGQQTYAFRVREMVRTVIESDLQFVPEHTITDFTNLSRLLYVIASAVPFKPNISKLSERIGLNRNRLIQYIYLLERARLLNLLHSDRRGITALQKPDKIYLENTNLMYALSPTGVEKGHLRETFVLTHLQNWIQTNHLDKVAVQYPEQGDFMLVGLQPGAFVIEVGGASKSKVQLKSASRGIVVRDDIEFGGEGVVPLWLFGFLLA